MSHVVPHGKARKFLYPLKFCFHDEPARVRDSLSYSQSSRQQANQSRCFSAKMKLTLLAVEIYLLFYTLLFYILFLTFM